jgi:hypothetical protein
MKIAKQAVPASVVVERLNRRFDSLFPGEFAVRERRRRDGRLVYFVARVATGEVTNPRLYLASTAREQGVLRPGEYLAA